MKKNKFLKFFVSIVILISLSFCFSQVVLAQGVDNFGVDVVGQQTGLEQGGGDIRVTIGNIIRVILGFLGVVFLVIIIYGGFLYLTSGGADEPVKKAIRVLRNAGIGLIIVLASFSIVSFAISKIQDSLGPGGDGDNGDQVLDLGDGDDDSGNLVKGLKVLKFAPQGSDVPRSALLEVEFSKSIDSTTIDDNFSVNKFLEDGGRELVEGEVSFNNKKTKLYFSPETTCPEPYTDKSCFEANSDYKVNFSKDKILDVTGDFKLNCTSPNKCLFSFSTSDIVDFSDPEVTLNVKKYIPIGTKVPVSIEAKDDSGIKEVAYYLGEDKVEGQALANYLKNYLHIFNLDTEGFQAEKTIKLKGWAVDVSGNQVMGSEVSTILKPLDCFDGQQDIICGEKCGVKCDGDECLDDSDCQSNVCSDGQCVNYPTIKQVLPSEAAVGSFITIKGYYFADYDKDRSKVLFTNESGEFIEGKFTCADYGNKFWSSSTIIVEVPEGAVSGAIKVINVDGFYDTTDNDRGLNDKFIVNNEKKYPGLCEVINTKTKLAEGEFNTSSIAFGTGFGNKQGDSNILFGSFTAEDVGVWEDKQLREVLVPNIQPGLVSVQVRVGENLSNPVDFKVLKSSLLPKLDSIVPGVGGRGELLTITGSNFGQDVGQVQFINKADESKVYIGETSCFENFWSPSEIKIKVPSEIPSELLGDYKVRLVKSNVYSQNSLDFELINDLPSPFLCKIEPKQAGPGSTVSLYGEGFGDFVQDRSFVQFYNNQKINTTQDFSDWSNDLIGKVKVPALAQTGEVFVTNSDSESTNSLNFIVDGKAVNLNPNGDKYYSEYKWTFYTGQKEELPIVPEVLEISDCSKELQSPTPSNNLEDVCLNAHPSVTFNTAMDPFSFAEKVELTYCLEEDKCDLKVCDEKDCAKEFLNIISDNFNEEKTRLTLDSLDLSKNTLYQVEILTGVISQQGLEMLNDYKWRFITGEEECRFNDILVEPNIKTFTKYEESQIFKASCLIKDTCQVVDCPEKVVWDWKLIDSIDDDILRAVLVDVLSNDGQTVLNTEKEVKAKAETKDGKPLALRINANYSNENFSDDSQIDITFSNPKVVDYGPGGQCLTACANAQIYADFNVYLDEGTLNNNSVGLYDCGTSSCAEKEFSEISAGKVNVNLKYSSLADSEISNLQINAIGNLELGHYYRVVLKDSVLSAGGKKLVDLNYATSGTEADAFSWTFKVKNNQGVCKLNSIEIIPENKVISELGELIQYLGVAKSGPDDCSSSGQVLKSEDYDWLWEVKKKTGYVGEFYKKENGFSSLKATSNIYNPIIKVKDNLTSAVISSVKATVNNIPESTDLTFTYSPLQNCEVVKDSAGSDFLGNDVNVCLNAVPTVEVEGKIQDISLANVSLKIGSTDIALEKVSSIYDEIDKKTTIYVYPKESLQEKSDYVLSFSNLKNECGKKIKSLSNPIKFSTGDSICKLSKVEAEPAVKDVYSRNESWNVVANAVSEDGSVIYPVAQKYAWSWEFFEDALVENTLLTLSNKTDSIIVSTTKNKNGQTNIIATANITYDVYGYHDTEKSYSGSQFVNINLCENPWEKNKDTVSYGGESKAFQNHLNDMYLYYCKDGGLPDLTIVAGQTEDPQIKIDEANNKFDKLLSEFFLTGSGKDAIALRVYTNKKGLPADLWYNKYVLNAGNIQEMEVACKIDDLEEYCYKGIQDGRTIYLSGGNHDGSGDVYNNIYVLAYSDGASEQTINIFSQLVNNLQFEKTLGNPAWLIRDIKRMNDVVYITQLLDNYYQNYSIYPELEAGTYVKGEVYSTWPSWQAVLGNELGSGLPVDPINKMNCDSSDGLDQTTCYNSGSKKYEGPVTPNKDNLFYKYKFDKASNNYDFDCYLEGVKQGCKYQGNYCDNGTF